MCRLEVCIIMHRHGISLGKFLSVAVTAASRFGVGQIPPRWLPVVTSMDVTTGRPTAVGLEQSYRMSLFRSIRCQRNKVHLLVPCMVARTGILHNIYFDYNFVYKIQNVKIRVWSFGDFIVLQQTDQSRMSMEQGFRFSKHACPIRRHGK